MQRRSLIPVIVTALLIIGAGNFLYWRKVVEPKDTRLAYYEALTTARNSRDNSADVMQKSLEGIRALNIKHLTRCERIAYHNIVANYRRRIDAKRSDVAANATRLQTKAARYLGYVPTLDELARLGEAEFAKVAAETAAFYAGLKDDGYTLSLDALANRPAGRTYDMDVVTDVYQQQIAKAEASFENQFFDYDVPKGDIILSSQTHAFSSYASYDRGANAMRLYKSDGEYDLDIAAFLSVHEIFPGHHLDAKGERGAALCSVNSVGPARIFMEGWATYAEFVADEVVFYDQAEQKLAWLDYRLTRAMRIILDVERMRGVRARQPLKQIWDTRMPKRLAGRFDEEYNRLTKSRHQHLSYILGYNAIADAKVQISDDMGDAFDVKVFHDVMLRLDHKEPTALYETVKIGMELVLIGD